MILKSFRDASHSLVIKILFTAIILSFCLWGVGDIIKNYSASKAVFTIDKVRFTVDQFLREYSQEKQRIRNIGSKPLTDAEMEKLNIKEMVLDRLINESILERAYDKLGIVIPKRTIIDVVQSLPQFQNNGTFDSRVYEMAIRRSGMSEQGFLSRIRESMAKNQLLHPIIAGYKLPSIIKETIAKEFDAKYTFLLAKVNLRTLAKTDETTDEALSQYYANNQDKYKMPETRDVSILVVDSRRLAAEVKIDEEEVDRIYNENKESYTPHETRDFERFVFDDKVAADKAWNLMNGGTSTEEIIKKLTPDMENVRGAKEADFPGKVGKALFSLKEGQASDVMSLHGKFYIYRLKKITAGQQRSEAEIKEEIRQELRNDQMNSPEFYAKIKEMKNVIDDGFGSGKTIDEISKETGMKVESIDGMKKDGVGLEKIIPDEDTRTEVIDAIFATEEGQASQTIDSREVDSLSYVVVVRKVVPSVVPEFESIRGKVLSDFEIEKKEKKLKDDMNEMMSLDTGAIEALKAKYGVRAYRFSKKDIINQKKQENPEVGRVLQEVPNPNAILNIISGLKKGEINFYKLSDEEYIVCGIEDVDRGSRPDKGFYDVISRYIDTGTANDASSAVISAFKKTMKVKVDRKLLDEITKNSDERGDE